MKLIQITTITRLALLPLIILAMGCVAPAKPPVVSLKNDGLHYDRDLRAAVDIMSQNPAKPIFISPEWHVNNWRLNKKKTAFEPIQQNPEINIVLDLNGDGKNEAIKQGFVELELTHRKIDAWISVDLMPLPQHQQEMKMSAFLQRVENALSGNFSWNILWESGAVGDRTRSFATERTYTQDFTLSDCDVIVGQINSADLNQIRINPSHISRQYLVALIRVPGYRFRAETTSAILTVLLSASPDAFDSVKNDLQTLVRSIQISGQPIDLNLSEAVFNKRQVSPPAPLLEGQTATTPASLPADTSENQP